MYVNAPWVLSQHRVTMDAEDSYFSKYYPEFYKVYSCDEEVKEKFMNNFEQYVEKYTERNYDKIYAIDSVAQITPETINRTKTVCGLISIDNLDGTGHWVAFRGCGRHLEVFDSMGTKTKYKDQVTFILKKKFPQLYDVNFTLRCIGPQPLAGIIPHESRIMKWALDNDKPMPPWEHSIITSYESQHQFCYLEAFMWLIDRPRRVYTVDPKENLQWIKKNARFLDPPPGFFYIYDPDRDERCEIPPF